MLKTILASTLLVAAVPASAVTMSFTNGTSGTGGTAGNVRTFSINGIAVQASAFSYNGSSLSQAFLGHFSNGLGVTNASEGNGSLSNSHTVDNVGSQDFILLAFNQAVNISSGVLRPYAVGTGVADNDAWVSYGNLTGAFSTSTTTTSTLPLTSPIFATLAANGRNVSGNGAGNFSTAFNTSGQFGNVWMIGAAVAGLPNFDANADGFKLGSMEVTAVPEPSTWAMMIAGFGAIGWSARRRRSAWKGKQLAA